MSVDVVVLMFSRGKEHASEVTSSLSTLSTLWCHAQVQHQEFTALWLASIILWQWPWNRQHRTNYAVKKYLRHEILWLLFLWNLFLKIKEMKYFYMKMWRWLLFTNEENLKYLLIGALIQIVNQPACLFLKPPIVRYACVTESKLRMNVHVLYC